MKKARLTLSAQPKLVSEDENRNEKDDFIFFENQPRATIRLRPKKV